MKKLRILIADDHELVRRGIRGLLETQRGWKVVGEAADGLDLVEKAKTLKPDVFVIDVSMPELDGLQAARKIREISPNARIVILTFHESDQIVRQALNAGSLGYVSKSDFAVSLIKAVDVVSEGRHFLGPKISETVLDGFIKTGNQPERTERLPGQLPPRQMEVVRLLAEGKANKEIAASLGITVRTVETHRAKVMFKLGIHSYNELVRYAIRNKMVQP
jgi:DNA-binding NarL/FixJ family response regulator